MPLSFVGSASAPVGTPIHLTVYLGGVALDPVVSPISWTGLPASISVSSDATGYVFSGSAVVTVAVVAHQGVAAGGLNLSFTSPPLQFTNP